MVLDVVAQGRLLIIKIRLMEEMKIAFFKKKHQGRNTDELENAVKRTNRDYTYAERQLSAVTGEEPFKIWGGNYD